MDTKQTATIATAKRPQAWCGADVSKITFDAALWLPLESDSPRQMKDIPVKTFKRSKEGVQAFIAWAKGLLAPYAKQNGSLPSTRVVMEATGSYSVELAVWMIEQCQSLSPAIINPETANAYFRSLALRNKTDRVDARALARFGYERRPSRYEPPTPEMAQLRDLSRYRQSVITTRVAEQHRSGEPHPSPVVRRMLKERLAQFLRQEEKIEKEMRKIVAKTPDLKRDAEAIEGVYGVGFITAVTVLAELGDLRRFEKARQLSASAGLSPRNCVSGTSVHKRSRMSKKGNKHVRKALYMPALAATRGDSDLADIYDRLMSEGKTHKAALCAVMRKMLLVMRAILISGELYEKHYCRSCG